MTFHERSRHTMQEANSLLCVGLDPQPDRTKPEDILTFNTEVIEATAPYVSAYKPQSAFYEVAGDVGWHALKETIKVIKRVAPDALVILDAKRGDVANTADACARALFEWFDADAATVNPYMGSDSVVPFLEWGRKGKGVFFLCRTSNLGSGDFQQLLVTGRDKKERPLFLEVAKRVQEWWLEYENCAGLVVGATHPDDLPAVRHLCPEVPILLPGVGAQGGSIEQSVPKGIDQCGLGLLVSSSRSIIYADDPGAEAKRVRDQINAARSRKPESAAQVDTGAAIPVP